MKKIIKKFAKQLRFGVVGIINTIIDFSLLFLLVLFGLPTIPSNFISTTSALIFSFFANKKFTFKDSDKNYLRQLVLFL